jgi:hypothetical protein
MPSYEFDDCGLKRLKINCGLDQKLSFDAHFNFALVKNIGGQRSRSLICSQIFKLKANIEKFQGVSVKDLFGY